MISQTYELVDLVAERYVVLEPVVFGVTIVTIIIFSLIVGYLLGNRHDKKTT